MDYALIRGRVGTQSHGAVRTIRAGGVRALPVFTTTAAAEEYLLLGGHGPEWEIAGGSGEAFVGLLREKIAPHVGFVVLDPPAHLRGGETPAVAPILIDEFLDQLEAAGG